MGFARVVSDRATFAYLADVFVLTEHRGQGLSKRLLETVLAHPELRGLRRWLLFTADAHTLYEQFGFVRTMFPVRIMEIRRPYIGDLSDATLKPGASRMLRRAEVEKLRGERQEAGIWKLESRKLRR